MPQDLLQIGLEHHRNGRLTQAEESYRSVLRESPGNAEAMHWLGVLHAQARKWKEAILWLEQAAAVRPADAAWHHNLAQAYLGAGEYDKAVHALEAASVIEPDRAQTRFVLGLALLARKGPEDAEEAAIAFSQAIALGMDTADAHRQLGAALLACGRGEQALEALTLSLEKHPKDAPARLLLAMVHRDLGHDSEVRKNLLKAVEIDPDFARGWSALAELDTEQGNLAQAAAFHRKALAIKPSDASVYHALGQVLLKSGKQEEGMAALRQAVRLSRADGSSSGTGDDHAGIAELEQRIKLEGNAAEMHYTLATIANITPPSQIPAALVTELFDRYADTFDAHLRQTLQYTLPEKITDAIAAVRPNRKIDILDLGCGTGLCGPLLRPWASWLAGIDLSPAMIKQASARNVYDVLEVCDLVEAMRRAERGFDLLVAADVLLYLGDLSPVFESATKCLRPGGLLAYSVEAAASGDRYYLQPHSKRFAHAEGYLKNLARMYGFVEESFESVTARMDADKPVPAYLVVLRWPG